ncbi:MAG: rod shape-determining protein MreC [Oxalicibacterium faecigallinarum]|uniref:Cell shape-determining protein MreC n=1 Tax=Oxalicibacterium faecigallinarum TaxID=573741 RepID=A0A8J3F2T0_9BURK|nr:rod shape-determining protein MreC [Oxalicibacterium faecigallinarum]MDQ7969526.1 rod shape-determining protein MreC [Oxalicibacterium faecigallinarum]GGI18846.1 rod shape-determining protein MreC [Oxalicibacterium faecigallinarum]
MEYSPPPLFKQGASARAKMVCFALIALVLLTVDSHMRSLGVVRQVVSTALYPLQVVALVPRDVLLYVGDYFTSLSEIKKENLLLKQQQTTDAQALQQGQHLVAENAQLRQLLDAKERVPVKSVMAEILYDTRDRFTRKIMLDRGSQHDVERGQPVIDHVGVVGQVTRVFPFSSEVTLVTDKDQVVPVQVVRNGLRSVAYGRGQSNLLELRFLPPNVDIEEGDMLVTSGIDGIYPAGLMVAKVTEVDRKSDSFARIVCTPLAGVDRNRQLLILLVENQFEPRPEDDAKQAARKKGLLGHASSRGDVVEEKKPDASASPASESTPEQKAP